MARNTPLIIVALVFFSLAAYLLFSAPDDPNAPTIESPQGLHPCPYAEILGLDENSVNPHTAGGALPPISGVRPAAHVDANTPPPKIDFGQLAGMPNLDHLPKVKIDMKDEL
jgi:hypothetical protein